MERRTDTVVVTGTLTAAQRTAAVAAFPVLVRRRRRVLGVTAVAVVCVVLVTVVTSDRPLTPLGVVLPCLVGLVLLLVVARRSRAAQSREDDVAQTWTFTPAGLTRASDRGEDTIGWERVTGLHRADGVVAMLWEPPGCVAALPESALDEDELAKVAAWWSAGRESTRLLPAAEAAPDGGVVVTAPRSLSLVRRTSLAVVPVRVLVLLPLVVAVTLVQDLIRPSARGGPSLLLLTAAVLGVAVPVLFEIGVRRAWREQAGSPVTWTAGPAGLGLQSSLGRSFVPWTRVESVQERPSGLVLRLRDPKAAIGLPTGALSRSDVRAVRAWASGEAPHGEAVC